MGLHKMCFPVLGSAFLLSILVFLLLNMKMNMNMNMNMNINMNMIIIIIMIITGLAIHWSRKILRK